MEQPQEQQQQPPRRYLTPGEVRRRLGICATTYHQLKRRDPTFPKVIQFGAGTKSLRILEADLDRWIAAREKVAA